MAKKAVTKKAAKKAVKKVAKKATKTENEIDHFSDNKNLPHKDIPAFLRINADKVGYKFNK